MRSRRRPLCLLRLYLVWAVLLLLAAAPLGSASSLPPVSGALFLSPQAGIGLVGRLPWWDLHAEGLLVGDGSAGAVQVTRVWPVKPTRFLPFALEAFGGVRYYSGEGFSLVGGVGKPFHLYPDLHLDLSAGLSLGTGGQAFGGFLGVKAVQDF
ncbi:MAG: hypothetical protein QME79_06260 [Bacillota bacterium]|nr:hypothetical protein [Bacillota bacterium]